MLFSIGVPIERVERLGMDEFFRAFQVNMFSGVRLCQVALPHLRKSRGGILFTSTGVVDIPMSGWSAYCSSKAAMNMFLKCLAREEAANLSAVMCVRPGIVDTDILTDIYSQRSRDQVMDADQYQFMQLQKEKGKLLSPEEPADVMAQLIIKAPRELNGAFFAFNDENVKSLLSQ